jgi:hypothetical protein
MPQPQEEFEPNDPIQDTERPDDTAVAFTIFVFLILSIVAIYLLQVLWDFSLLLMQYLDAAGGPYARL